LFSTRISHELFEPQGVKNKENVRFTTPIQQMHNNPSNDDGNYTLGTTLM
jgi:hypothetical protein